MENLKPCPFCGSEAIVKDLVDAKFVACEKCDASTAMWFDSIGDAIASWNTRHHPTCETCKEYSEYYEEVTNYKRRVTVCLNGYTRDQGPDFGCLHHQPKQ